MKITLTIEIDGNNVSVKQNSNNAGNNNNNNSNKQNKFNNNNNNGKFRGVPPKSIIDIAKAEPQAEPIKETRDKDKEMIGEKLPKGKWATKDRPRTEEYPFNVGDAKREMQSAEVSMPELAEAMGNFPITKLRNIFRYDNRRFTREDYNVILKAIDSIKKSKEII